MKDNLRCSSTPDGVAEKAGAARRAIRVGGLVEAERSVSPNGDRGLRRDRRTTHDLEVAYQRLLRQLPDLFREGQGVVAKACWRRRGELHAATILAKHDERYMPREVVDALKKQGRWQEGEASAK